jgi:hypothetical protein
MTIKDFTKGCVGGVLPFPLNQTRTSDFTELNKMLGERFYLGQGVWAVLVQANAALTSHASRCLEWQDSDIFEVVATTGTGKTACGICPPYQEDVAADGYFLMLVGEAGSQITTIAHAAITKLDAVQPTAAGRVLTDSGIQIGVSLGYAEEAASNQGDTVLVRIADGAFSSPAV